MIYRYAGRDDARMLAEMNLQLIRDEGHRNQMNVQQLEERMRGWLQGEYQAVLFEQADEVVGYALFRREPEWVRREDEWIYLRHFFVRPCCRRRGIGRAAMQWCLANCWMGTTRVRIDVMVNNAVGLAFWRSAGCLDYSIPRSLHSHDPCICSVAHFTPTAARGQAVGDEDGDLGARSLRVALDRRAWLNDK